MKQKIEKPDDEWREQLSSEQFKICRQKGTEAPFTGEYYATKTDGIYRCACCGEALFDSVSKYDSGSGWPSFFKALNDDAVEEDRDTSHGMVRTEVHCAKCDSHLGHLFPDGPQPTGLRYCINSASLALDSDDKKES
ncbi:peptide-methionine (R)-S-oxide reductase MsrB [Solemya velum gill symbiont]|uniref:Peptide methionine sulfoxide reductase MsrB n=1 Tax=Solemya velum gill symbiont TaxID=2340 RepID=A0A0B0HF43_SOVGS|nr:peptide-methionine (R)-S-oxide reductase MsrB [Solemya velum gill symbiont]KHF26086.1 methionine-R-sulfoxide reductase [Solemya velum gill symbiont]OOY34691.1 peptide-methionine (R)-S-oxide reductase [Solemya velum gill symbiont]OOY37486.1 peptide-methionine (R)-S-oxide reductase [Solemya velum gill symbiont]OOY47493.1 peptide-methionine (R)-S-oxide reductase [Solemya velum gill symbiont]OOY47675.1 peptide-methionine (R)-S-oxide reductase [Solemya velum gill symbiont]